MGQFNQAGYYYYFCFNILFYIGVHVTIINKIYIYICKEAF